MQMVHKVNKNITKFLQFRYFSSVKSTNDNRPILYGDEASPLVRFVMMTASALNIDVKFHKIDLFKNENRREIYRRINPLQKVPAMKVGDTNILDSHAIALYMCQIAKEQGLYPGNPIMRAKVNEMLFFNSSTLFRIDSYILSTYFAGQWPVSETTIEEWYSALDFLENQLNDGFLTGNKVLLCDISAVAIVTSVLSLVPLTQRHERVQKWIEKFEHFKYYDINKRGLLRLNSYVNAYKVIQM